MRFSGKMRFVRELDTDRNADTHDIALHSPRLKKNGTVLDVHAEREAPRIMRFLPTCRQILRGEEWISEEFTTAAK